MVSQIEGDIYYVPNELEEGITSAVSSNCQILDCLKTVAILTQVPSESLLHYTCINLSVSMNNSWSLI